MNTTLTERYRRWFDYEKDSHAKTMASLVAVAATHPEAPAFAKAKSLMAHLVQARRLWLYRLGAATDAPKADEFFPEDVDLADLAARLEAVQAAWDRYLSTLDDEKVAQTFEYNALDGARFRNTVVDVLTQLYGHSLYHRGQIALLLRSIGAEPAVTDFVFWSREPL